MIAKSLTKKVYREISYTKSDVNNDIELLAELKKGNQQENQKWIIYKISNIKDSLKWLNKTISEYNALDYKDIIKHQKYFDLFYKLDFDPWIQKLLWIYEFRSFFGKIRPINWKKRKLKLPIFLYFLSIYRLYRVYNIPKELLQSSFGLTKYRLEKIIAIFFDLHCRMKECVLLPFYRS